MSKYKLGFLTDAQIFEHVKNTVLAYVTQIDLKKFNKNIIDPIKLTFDAKVYGSSFDAVIEQECLRQIDKANTNLIGYFHQNLFKHIGKGWEVPKKGFDIVNKRKGIYVEMKNKHNTMNANSAQATYMKMQQQLIKDSKSCCMLVEVIAKHSQNTPWKVTFFGEPFEHEQIRRVSIDKFYEIVFNDKIAFAKLCKALPLILDDVVREINKGCIESSVAEELQLLSNNSFKSLFLLAFGTYEGFDKF